MTSLEKALMCFGWMMAAPALFLLGVYLFSSSCARINVWRGPRRGVCRVCFCTENDCMECLLATGEPCYWIDASHTLCSRCVDHLDAFDISTHRKDLLSPDCPPLNAVRGRGSKDRRAA